jgi:hypothetical protein
MRKSYGLVLTASLAATAALSGSANAADKIKLGFFSTLEGTYTALGEDGQRGFDLAIMQHHNKAGGKDLEIVRGSSDASPDSALRAAKKLVEQDKVDVLRFAEFFVAVAEVAVDFIEREERGSRFIVIVGGTERRAGESFFRRPSVL